LISLNCNIFYVFLLFVAIKFCRKHLHVMQELYF